MPNYLNNQNNNNTFRQYIPQQQSLSTLNQSKNISSNSLNYPNNYPQILEDHFGIQNNNQSIYSNILPSQESTSHLNELKSDNILNNNNNTSISQQNQNSQILSTKNSNQNNNTLNINYNNNQINSSSSSSSTFQQIIPSQQYNNNNDLLNNNNFPTNIPLWFDYQQQNNNNNNLLFLNDNSTTFSEYFHPFNNTSSFDYNNNGSIGGILPSSSIYHPNNYHNYYNFLINNNDENQSLLLPQNNYFSVGGLYDSLAALAASTGHIIGEDSSSQQNFCWPTSTFDYYGGQQNNNSSINWIPWGYPLIDNSVEDLINQQNNSVDSTSLNVFDSICPIIEGNVEIKNKNVQNSSNYFSIQKRQINSQNPKNWKKTSSHKGKVGNTSLPTTNANGPQKIESQSEHCSNINSSITNSNESGNTTLLNNEHQKNLISPLLLHFPPIRQLTSEVMRDYLANPGRYECAMWIFHAKVAQKSYGNEKRFFCPPPCIYLFGDGWKNRRKALDQIFKQLKEKNELNCSDFFPNGEYCHEMLSEISVTIGINSPQNNTERLQHIAHSLDFSNGKDYCAAKALFISDTDKRKYFYLQTTFSNVCGINIGTFSSQRIKVISKPSKKKQSMKSSDCKYLCVSNGSKIALFNRLRSQTVSTRYLHVENGCFHASSTKWGAFHINSDNTQPSSSNNSNISQTCTTTIITYGSIIQLVDAQSNIALPSLRIRKVDKQMVLLDPSNQGEPVSQLHKCAFQMVDSSGTVIVGKESLYLCLSHDKIIQHQAVQIDPNRHQISDGAAWTIISTDKSEYRWAEPLSRLGSIARLPITPMPQLHNLNILNNSEINNEIRSEIPENIELNGLNFSPSMRVWLGASPTETIFCSSERLKCSIPSFNSICSDLGFTTESAILANASTTKNEKLDVPIIIVREEDSVVFPTSLSFAYNLDSLSNLTNISRQPLTLTQMNNKKQQQSTSFNENNNNLLLETSSTNKINNFNRFHPYWNNSENGSSDSIVK